MERVVDNPPVNLPPVKTVNKPKEITLCILKVTALALATLGLMALAVAGGVFFFPPLAGLAIPTAVVGFGLCTYFISTTVDKMRKNKPLPQQQLSQNESPRPNPEIEELLNLHAETKRGFQEKALVEYKKYTKVALEEIDLFQNQLNIDDPDFATNCNLLAFAIQNCNKYIKLSEVIGTKDTILNSEEHRSLLSKLNELIDKLLKFQGNVDQDKLPQEYETLFQALVEICSTVVSTI